MADRLHGHGVPPGSKSERVRQETEGKQSEANESEAQQNVEGQAKESEVQQARDLAQPIHFCFQHRHLGE